VTQEIDMSEMVRKQFYIYKRQHILLKRLSQARGVSEAEIVRQAIEREATGVSPQSLLPDRAAWEEIVNFVEARKALGPNGEPYQWNREDAYEERENRFDSTHTE
jgi:hypothetical protein